MLEAAVLRSPHANARLTGIDAEAAMAVDGVRAVVTAHDSPSYDGSSILTAEPDFAGAGGGGVGAGGRDSLEAGLAALAPTYEVLGFVTDLDAALEGQRLLGDPSESDR